MPSINTLNKDIHSAISRNAFDKFQRLLKDLNQLERDTSKPSVRLINTLYSKRGYNPLHLAVSLNNRLEMIRLLLKHGADPNAKTREGTESAFQLLCDAQNINLEILKLLLEYGAEVDQTGGDQKKTPLYLAATKHDSQVLQLLLSYSQNPNTAFQCFIRFMEQPRTVVAKTNQLSDALNMGMQTEFNKIFAFLMHPNINLEITDETGATQLETWLFRLCCRNIPSTSGKSLKISNDFWVTYFIRMMILFSSPHPVNYNRPSDIKRYITTCYQFFNKNSLQALKGITVETESDLNNIFIAALRKTAQNNAEALEMINETVLAVKNLFTSITKQVKNFVGKVHSEIEQTKQHPFSTSPSFSLPDLLTAKLYLLYLQLHQNPQEKSRLFKVPQELRIMVVKKWLIAETTMTLKKPMRSQKLSMEATLDTQDNVTHLERLTLTS